MKSLFKQKIQVWLGLPALKRENLETLFTVSAPKYHLATRTLSLGRDHAWKKILIDNLPLLQAPSCVDIACGSGDLSFLLAQRYTEGSVVAIDYNPLMLQLAEANNSYANIQFVRADMCNLDNVASDSVDLVTGGYALRNASDLNKVLDEIKRILKVGGTAAFLEFSRPQSQVMQKIQYYILKSWGGLWGLLLHGNYEIYAYLAESLAVFPTHNELLAKLVQQGFGEISSRSLFCGMLKIITCKKAA
ncbi:MAG TPA: class I SAM-dependent methyltransferase [Gammaproteobacteria bacterium]|nr:class I SAM-dependent methyltransferase [Gammaproteobacteria bacterium]